MQQRLMRKATEIRGKRLKEKGFRRRCLDSVMRVNSGWRIKISDDQAKHRRSDEAVTDGLIFQNERLIFGSHGEAKSIYSGFCYLFVI
jgi:ribosomal protein L32E